MKWKLFPCAPVAPALASPLSRPRLGRMVHCVQSGSGAGAGMEAFPPTSQLSVSLELAKFELEIGREN